MLFKIDWLNLYSPKDLHFSLVYPHFILSFRLLSKRAYVWCKMSSSFTINFFNLLHMLIYRLIIVRRSWATRNHPNSSIHHSRRFWFCFLSRLLQFLIFFFFLFLFEYIKYCLYFGFLFSLCDLVLFLYDTCCFFVLKYLLGYTAFDLLPILHPSLTYYTNYCMYNSNIV